MAKKIVRMSTSKNHSAHLRLHKGAYKKGKKR